MYTTDERMQAIWGHSPADIWAGGRAGLVHWDGTDWRPSPGIDSHVTAIWGASAESVWAADDGGTVYFYNGSAWALTHKAGREAVRAIWGASDDDVWVVGDRGLMLHWDGNDWSRVGNSAASDFDTGVPPVGDMFVRANDDVWITHGGALLHWDGDTVTAIAVPSIDRVLGITGSSTELCTAGGILATSRFHVRDQSVAGADPLSIGSRPSST